MLRSTQRGATFNSAGRCVEYSGALRLTVRNAVFTTAERGVHASAVFLIAPHRPDCHENADDEEGGKLVGDR